MKKSVALTINIIVLLLIVFSAVCFFLGFSGQAVIGSLLVQFASGEAALIVALVLVVIELLAETSKAKKMKENAEDEEIEQQEDTQPSEQFEKTLEASVVHLGETVEISQVQPEIEHTVELNETVQPTQEDDEIIIIDDEEEHNQSTGQLQVITDTIEYKMNDSSKQSEAEEVCEIVEDEEAEVIVDQQSAEDVIEVVEENETLQEQTEIVVEPETDETVCDSVRQDNDPAEEISEEQQEAEVISDDTVNQEEETVITEEEKTAELEVSVPHVEVKVEPLFERTAPMHLPEEMKMVDLEANVEATENIKTVDLHEFENENVEQTHLSEGVKQSLQAELSKDQIEYINSSDSSYINEAGLPQLKVTTDLKSTPVIEKAKTVQKTVDHEKEIYEEFEKEERLERVIEILDGVIIILILAILALGGYYLYRRFLG